MDYAVWLLAGTLFGFLIGIIPVAGATIGLITLFGLKFKLSTFRRKKVEDD